MSIEYLGLNEINGPLVVLEGVQNASFEEIVEIVVDNNEKKLGRIVELYEDKAVIQVFEGNEGMSLKNTHTKLTGHPMELAVSLDILGRTFNGIGQPIDGLGLIDSLDFGAGAYYYADIPQFAKYVDGSYYKSPVSIWVLIALFLIWGFFMYKLWGWIEKKDK